MPRYYHGGREAVDPTKFFPESLTGEGELDEVAKKAIEDERAEIVKRVAKEHPLTSPSTRDSTLGKNDRAIVSQDGKLKLKRPLAFCQRQQTVTDETGRAVTRKIQDYDDWTPGSVVLALQGYGYWIVPPGGHVDLDITIPESLVKSYAPHLLTEAEHEQMKARVAEKQKQQPQSHKKTNHPEQSAPKG